MTETTTPVQDAPVATDDAKPVISPGEATAADAGAGQEEQAQEKTFTQAELDALIQKRLLKEERRIHRRLEAQLREQIATQPAPEPKREAFSTDEAYNQAQIEHRIAQEAERIAQEREAKKQAEARRQTFLERSEAAQEKYPDYDAVVSNPALPINEAMAEFIAESEAGPDVAYYLGKNPATARRIAEMSPVKAGRELARIEAELASKPKATPSKAPEPITPVGSRGKTATSSLPSDEDDIETWMKKERDRVRKAR